MTTIAAPAARTAADPAPPPTIPAVVGAALSVPILPVGRVGYANLDHAASAPCMTAVRDAVDELLPWYASVHRGAGFASRVCTDLVEQARTVVRRFVGAAPDATVVFTRNTTDSLNVLAGCLRQDTTVVVFEGDHHAAVLPWAGHAVVRLPVPDAPARAVESLRDALRAAPPGPRLAVLTGASNVTGELWPVADLVAVAREHGARTVLDAAQLAPHAPVCAEDLGVDWVALSGHKIYAPFGTGALVGRADWLDAAEPRLRGGGAVSSVDGSGAGLAVVWRQGPERHEAGSPNVVGIHALAAACRTFAEAGWQAVRTHEEPLAGLLVSGLEATGVTRRVTMWGPTHPSVGTISFTVDGMDSGLVAAALSAEYGIGVRDGAFCAHLGVRHLLGDGPGGSTGGAVRASLGLGSTAEHVQRLHVAVAELARRGPRCSYGRDRGRWVPEPDPRPRPPFVRLDDDAGHADGCSYRT